jgi:hypothetical protein
VVQNGFTVEIPQVPTEHEKKLIQMDAQAKDELVAISLVHSFFAIASVRLRRICGTS